ncbi:MAG: hypothetical protein MUE59_04675 [Thiobacillaceae bacterium]|jgi:hypothetical protein|nr:hypothetical protein [Thiobacillaceae bacterium]
MSDNPLLNKMDALLKKHRGVPDQASTEDAPAPDAWLPVLTDVIERGTIPPQLAAASPVPPAPSAPATAASQQSAREDPPAPTTSVEPEPSPDEVTDTMAEQLLSELTPRLSQIMEKQVASELRKNLDETVSALLSQLDVNVREIVRDAVAEKLRSRPPSGETKN